MDPRRRKIAIRGLLGLLAALSAGGFSCASIGPTTVTRDRLDYGTALTESWKRQALLNIVKLRYLDPPTFVDVGSIVSGYTLETSGAVGGTVFPNAPGDSITAGAQGKFTDRPTVTYVPLTGKSFMGGLMTPLPPESLFFTIQSGWPADVMMRLGVVAINGHRNEEASITGWSRAEPEFTRISELMRRIQLRGAVNIRVQVDEAKRQSALFTLHGKNVSPETREESAELRRLLGLDPDAIEFRLVFGSVAANDKEIAVLTRSILHTIQTLAMRVEVPETDVAEGRAVPGALGTISDGTLGERVFVRSSEADPTKEAFVSIRYRDRWFWIDDRDLVAKRDFAFIMLLFALANTGSEAGLPVITIPA